MAEDPIIGTYVRGRLALADIRLSAPFHVWLDAVYAAAVESPAEVLEKMAKQMIIKSAMVDPDAARETWGALPEHQVLAGKLGSVSRAPAMQAAPKRRPQAGG